MHVENADIRRKEFILEERTLQMLAIHILNIDIIVKNMLEIKKCHVWVN